MATISVRVEKSGRILIPAAIRRRLGLTDGESELLLEVDETPIRLTTRAQAVQRLQDAVARYGEPNELWSEELIRDRRRDAADEFEG
jgi:AbrB family looped-hinge helix DNA binding protein